MRDSVAAGQTDGFFATGTGTELNLENSVATENSIGLNAVASAAIRASNMMITDNTTGLASSSGGTLVSWVNNRVDGNGTAGAFSSTIPQA